MIIATLCYCCIGFYYYHYSLEKVFCIFLICSIYSVESIEDVFWGLFQQNERLDIGGKFFSIRWISILSICGFCLFLTKNLVISLLISFCFSFILSIFMLSYSYRKMSIQKKKPQGTLKLLVACFPLFLSGFLSFYILNAPKYAIDLCLSDSVQACYGFVAMPVFVIGLLNNFIYQPQLVKMSIIWKDGNIREFQIKIIKQLCIIVLLTCFCELGAYLIGIPVLSWLYNTNLSDYKHELLILLLGGGLLSIVGYLSTILTLIRHQKTQLYIYLVVAIGALMLSKLFVTRFQTIGAALLYLILVTLLAIGFVFFVFHYIAKTKTKNIAKI